DRRVRRWFRLLAAMLHSGIMRLGRSSGSRVRALFEKEFPLTRGLNFSAGPAALPEAVLRQAQSELLDWGGARASVMEISHRSAEFMALAEESERDLRDLLAIPSDYRVLF